MEKVLVFSRYLFLKEKVVSYEMFHFVFFTSSAVSSFGNLWVDTNLAQLEENVLLVEHMQEYPLKTKDENRNKVRII